jgi:hypothetical protein
MYQISNFMKIHLVGAQVTHADGHKDTTKTTVTICNSVNMPKTGIQQIYKAIFNSSTFKLWIIKICNKNCVVTILIKI